MWPIEHEIKAAVATTLDQSLTPAENAENVVAMLKARFDVDVPAIVRERRGPMAGVTR